MYKDSFKHLQWNLCKMVNGKKCLTSSNDQNQPPGVFYKKAFLKKIAIFTGKLRLGVFLWILWIFWEHLFWRTSTNGYFWMMFHRILHIPLRKMKFWKYSKAVILERTNGLFKKRYVLCPIKEVPFDRRYDETLFIFLWCIVVESIQIYCL